MSKYTEREWELEAKRSLVESQRRREAVRLYPRHASIVFALEVFLIFVFFCAIVLTGVMLAPVGSMPSAP